MTQLDPAAGSHLWQTLFVSFAVVLVLFEMLRGWRLGLPRQFVRLIAIVAAYGAAFYGGPAMVPVARQFFRLPDFALSAIGGAALAFVIYAVISGAGALVFRRTAQQESGMLRLIYGASGAFIGIFFGLFFVWMLLLGVRSLGSIADARVRAANGESLPPNARRIVGGRMVDARTGDAGSLPETLARLKNSVELGVLGDAVKKLDPLPPGTFQTLGKVGETFAKPENTERFLSFPGARELSMHPRIVQLRQDPHVAKLISEGRFLELLQDQRLIDALNDPTLIERLKKFDLQRALDYAMHGEPEDAQQ